MKLIDEKGRLFGKVNIIDLAIVLLVLAALAGISYKFGFIKKIGTSDVNQKKVLVTLWVKKVSPFTSSSIAVGDVIKEIKSNSEIGKVVDVKVTPAVDIAPNAQGQWVKSNVPDYNDVYVKIETISNSLRLGSKDAKVGNTVEISGPKFQTTSIVAEVK